MKKTRADSLWLRPDDGPDIVYEFFAPFAHVEGKYEWCRIRSPTHGVFDTFILLARKPVVVYVNSAAGEAFMRDRFPECRTIRVAARDLRIAEKDGGRTVEGVLKALTGPILDAKMRLSASADAPLRNVPYGGTGEPVWGSTRWTCWGVDLVAKGEADGRIAWRDGPIERLAGKPALITLGSFGRIAPLAIPRATRA